MNLARVVLFTLVYLSFLVSGGCRGHEPEALGTLEWDVIRGRAPAAEMITEVYVREGETVEAGQPLLQFDAGKQEAVVARLTAELEQANWRMKELTTGPREETIAELEARIGGAESALANAESIYNRQSELFDNDFTSRELLDIAENNYTQAKSSLAALREQLREKKNGTRVEVQAQARAKAAATAAELQQARLQLADYTVRAGRQGRVEDLPYKKGDRPPAQAVVSTVTTGRAPWARIYVPEKYRSRIEPAKRSHIRIYGQAGVFPARLRYIAVRPSFTPYYALTERDRSRLVYVGEFVLDEEQAQALTAGTPVQLILEDL